MTYHDDARYAAIAASNKVYDDKFAELAAERDTLRRNITELNTSLATLTDRVTQSIEQLRVTTAEREAIRQQYVDLSREYTAHMETHDDPDPDPEPEPEPGEFPMVPSIALNPKTPENYQKLANDIGVNGNWFLRAYHGTAFKPLDQFNWYQWARDNFGGMIFSTQHGTTDASYAATARGDHYETWARIVDSWPADMPGGINLGNEMNLEPVQASIYRDAIEYLIDTFDLPDNVFWTLAYSNWKSWTAAGLRSPGAQAGALYLPRTDKRILVLTHTYGKDEWPDVVNQQAGFHAEMDKHPTWLRGIGETSAKENPNNPDSKANYLVGAAREMERHGGCVFSLFDSETGGSDVIASTPRTAATVKAWAATVEDNRWT